MFGKAVGDGSWWTVGVDCVEERHRFVMVDDRGERQRIGIGAKWIAIGSDRCQIGAMIGIGATYTLPHLSVLDSG